MRACAVCPMTSDTSGIQADVGTILGAYVLLHVECLRREPYRSVQLHIIRDHDASLPGRLQGTPHRALCEHHASLHGSA